MKILNNQVLKNLLAKPLFRASDARKVNIYPATLNYYIKINLLERIGRGVYRGVNSTIDAPFQWEDMILTVKSVSNGVVCLISALAIYELTDEIPRMHWIAIPHSKTAPKREHTHFIRMRDISTGKVKHNLGKETIPIFNQERTVIDAFRYLSKEIAIKALKEAVKPKRKMKFDLKKFQQYSKKFRMDLTPYILMVST